MNPMRMRLKPPVLLTAALLLGAGPAAATSPPWDPVRAVTLSDWRWSGPEVFELAGTQMHIWQFRAPQGPAEAARRLKEAGLPRFDRLQFSAAALSLAGLHEGRHWLAQLRPAAGQTAGILSSLGAYSPRPAAFDPAVLVPAGARPVLRASSRLATGDSLIASYLCPGSYPRVAAALRQALWQQQWRPLVPQGPDDPQRQPVFATAGEWAQSGGARLTVHLQVRADAVALTFWHRAKEAS